MKKFLQVLLVSLLAVSLVACGSKETPAPNQGGDDVKEPIKVALILPYIGDQSYFDVTYRGLTLVDEKYDDSEVVTKLIEMGTDEALWAAAFTQACDDGYNIIISGNWQYEGYMLDAAKEYPDVKFINFDYSSPEANALPNVYGVTYKCQEIGFLAGIVAATKSETGIIGGIGGMDIGGIQQFLAGYIEGALAVNPDIKVMISFVGDFGDTGKAKELAEGMNKNGADVVYHAAGGAGNGVFEAAAANGFWAIGVDTDQYVSLSEKPELQATVLTSALKNCDLAILDAVTAAVDGSLAWGTLKALGINERGVGLAENDYYKANMTAEELAVVDGLVAKLKAGEIVVTDVLVTPEKWTELVESVK